MNSESLLSKERIVGRDLHPQLVHYPDSSFNCVANDIPATYGLEEFRLCDGTRVKEGGKSYVIQISRVLAQALLQHACSD